MRHLEIGLIGYRNHSSRVIEKILISNKVSKLICFCYKKNKISDLNNLNKDPRIIFTDNFNNIINSDAYFITSPSNTHLFYLKKLIKYKKPIFCEKTGLVNLREYKLLKNLYNKNQGKIYFNYNFLHSDFYKIFNEIYYRDAKDKLIHFIIIAGNGIAYKNKFKKNWRFKSKNILERITGNIGVHYINFLIQFLGMPSKLLVMEKNISYKSSVDTSVIEVKFRNGVSGSIILSYASPLVDDMTFLFSNKILKYSKNKLSVFKPRETFNSKGYFVYPGKKNNYSFGINSSDKSLFKSIDYFLTKTSKRSSFKKKLFSNAINTSKVFLNAKNNY